MSTGRVTGRFNQAGALAPLTSPYGREMFAATSQLIDQPAPLVGWRWSKFVKGNIGGLNTQAANVGLVVGAQGYSGDFPQTEQAALQVAPPWERP